ncbi:ethanolamine kinase 1-like [Lineus longissimus]|uniref:ethanolamine kinase 1-like n=1 Tax=Lineus longissimus TaxID=88925 RepID=UPI002B4D0117
MAAYLLKYQVICSLDTSLSPAPAACSYPSTMASTVLVLDVTVEPSNLEEGLYGILNHVREGWNKDDIIFKKMPSFFSSNQNTVCRTSDDMAGAVMIRVCCGQGDTQQELAATQLLHEILASPRLICTFKNGVCHEFVQGNSCNWNDISAFKDVNIAKAVAREVAKIHSEQALHLALNKYGIKDHVVPFGYLFGMLQNWSTNTGNSEIDAMLSSHFPSADVLQKEIEGLMKMVTDEGIATVFGHNDANPTNVIYNPAQGVATLVDYEVCGMSPETYDLASFLESSATGMYPDVDARRHSPDFQKEFLKEYIKTKRILEGSGDDITEKDVEKLYILTTKTVLIVYLISAMAFVTIGANPMPGSGIAGKDLIGLGITRYMWYQTNKEEILALKVPE